ncbi:MAG: U32 family peptidase [Clostridia bacterium]|nr:U32 family peptidase [Clostridia bacterium]
MIEVLAPAGSLESFEAAVRSGADAVYFGVGDFNARRNAKNFTTEDMRQAAEIARVRGVKTYLTLNTLTADSELSAALRAAETAAKVGIDALIVQDLGLARLLKRHLPNMPIHASTQMSVHSPEALLPLKEMGFERVVVAREMDKTSLAALCDEAKRLGLEVEAFVHGALCMCLSGQCYLSSVLGGRSGNRGLCAQPCRLEFAVENGTGHDLSLKDMSYISHIAEMAEMGVTSFKIEGRMKRPESVAAAVSAVRSAADGKKINPDTAELLSGIFSRSGHTDGYYQNRLGRDMFGIRTDSDTQMTAKMINQAHEIYRREYSRVPVFANVSVKASQPLTLTVWDNDNRLIEVLGNVPETAKVRAVDREFLVSKLDKTGGTPYYFENINCEIDEGLSVSASAISELRRQCFEKLTERRAEYDGNRAFGSTVSEYNPQTVGTTKKPIKTVASFRNISQIPDDLSGISAVILPCECDFSKLNLPEGIEIIADIPRGILHTADKVLQQLKNAKANGVKAAVCGNLAAFPLAEKAELTPISGFSMNVFNSESISAVADMGAVASVLSFEMSMNDIFRLNGKLALGIISYGRLPLMLFRNCPNKNGGGCKNCNGYAELTDRKGVSFPVMCRGEFSEMFNSRPVWMFDRKSEFKNLDFEVLYFTDETKERCQEVLTAFRTNAKADVEFTRGLYYREVF